MKRFLEYARDSQEQVIHLIREFVECESPSDSRDHVNRLQNLLALRTTDLATAQRIRGGSFGDHLRLEFDGASQSAGQVLCLGHADTVWPLGTLKSMPFRRTLDRLLGPGVLDMKAGLAFLIHAVRAIHATGRQPQRKIVLLVVSDEEVGSPSSRAVTEQEARNSDHVLVLEPGTGLTGKLKTARKGVGRYTFQIRGIAAHAGVDFENGASAITEAAHQILRITALTNLSDGVTVNPGVISGGTSSNVVAAGATIEVDLRVKSASQAADLDAAIRAFNVVDPRCTIHIQGGINRPPMERTEAIARLFEHARSLAGQIGVNLEESATGGASDGNFTAALNIPTLDGLGAVGEGAHAANEGILINRIPDRIALLAGLLTTGSGS